jgi:hypothetical protein
MTGKINKESITGLTTQKKEILRSLMGSVNNKIDMNKMMEEMQETERYCSIKDSIIESCEEVKQMKKGKKSKNTLEDLWENIEKWKDEENE